MLQRFAWFAYGFLAACTPHANDVEVRLAPDIVSSLDGTLQVSATVLADREPASKEAVTIALDYTDRNGVAHAIAPVDGKTDDKGLFETTITGLAWDGTGTVTATLGTSMIDGTATFAVLDRTPPTAAIMAPAQVHRGDTTIMVHVQDEIGISQVDFEADGANGGGGNADRTRSTVVASGSADATVTFDLAISDQVPLGATVTLYALAADLSGNQAAAQPVTVTVIQ